MKLGFYIIITILLSAVISGILAEESGYISIYYSTYVIEMSLVIFFIINASFFLFLYFLSKIINTPSLLIIKAQKYKQENANSFIEKSYIKLLQGDYKRAEKYAIKAFSHCDTPLLAYSQAALAADHIDSKNNRDKWINIAYDRLPYAKEAILLLQAKFQFIDGNHKAALEYTEKIIAVNSENPLAINLLKDIYFEQKDWDKLKEILPLLKKLKKSEISELNRLETEIFTGAVNSINDIESLQNIWKTANKITKQDENFITLYCQKLIENNHDETASKIITTYLKKSYSYRLISIYTTLNHDETETSVKKIHLWMKSFGHQAELLLAAANICIKANLWGQSHRYLEESLAIELNPDTYMTLGVVLSKLGKTEAANKAFQEGLSLDSITRTK
tara:strand:+ start:1161 stop:2333 length:1173 start_codon:yes stop_codon:yes gene_type:complete